jgi:Phage Mu protein F like protein
LYANTCDCCSGDVLPNLADNTDRSWDDIYTEIARQLLEDDNAQSNDALYSKTANVLMQSIYNGLGGSEFDDTDTRFDLLKSFKINIDKFSYAKTLTQFQYFKDNMFDKNGKPLGFDELRKVIADQGEVFNNQYLSAEHQFCNQSAIMAHKWHTLDAEYLEFTTVGDRRVRTEHKLFDKFTALKTDKIWKRLYTPLAWGCRCTIIPGIVKNVHQEYNSEWADKMVDPLVKGTIFDNNVGITKEIFTKDHPYFKSK